MLPRSLTAMAAALFALTAAAGCSTSTSHPDVAPSPHSEAGTSTEAGSATEAGSSTGAGESGTAAGESTDTTDAAGVPAAIVVDGPGKLRVSLGDELAVSTAEVSSLATDNGAVLQIAQPGAETLAAADVVGTGKATLTVTAADGSYDVVVRARP